MAIKAQFWIYSKKENSTARPGPDTQPTVSHECELFEPSSIESPALVLDLGQINNPCRFNYCFVDWFKRYYYVTDWTYADGLWTASLSLDPLASWRQEIMDTTAYVTRAAARKNGSIMDNLYPATGNVSTVNIVGNSPWATSGDVFAQGSFVVAVNGKRTEHYIMTFGALNAFLQYLYSDAYAADLVGPQWSTTYPQLKAQSNPLQYISSIKWFPIKLTGTPVDSISVGWVDVPASVAKINESGIYSGKTIFQLNRARHPQSARGSYLNNAPYASYSLVYPPWGVVDIDPAAIANTPAGTGLEALWLLDARTGSGTLVLIANDIVLSTLHAAIAVDYATTQIVARGYGIGNSLAPAINTAAAVLSGNIPGAVASTTAAIGDFAASKVPTAKSLGSPGGLAPLRGNPTLQCEFKQLAPDDNTDLGSPLCERTRLGDLPGYVQCMSPEVKIPATATEIATINQMLSGGVFID